MIRCIFYPGAKLFVTSGGKFCKESDFMSAKNIINTFEKIDTEEKAYWLGFLYADGNVSNHENKIELILAEKDVGHLEKFKRFLNIKNKICYREATKAYRISFRSEKCKQDLIDKGCIPNKSLILKFHSP